MTSNTPYVQSGDPLHEFLRSFWQRQVDQAEQETPDYRHPPLPLARIKKVMKSDPEVKMIAADAPILFCKACEIFIAEITARAFIVADSNKRRTLCRADIAKALSKSDQFDFLIDIVPRDEVIGTKKGSTKRDSQKQQGVDQQTDPNAMHEAEGAAPAEGGMPQQVDLQHFQSLLQQGPSASMDSTQLP